MLNKKFSQENITNTTAMITYIVILYPNNHTNTFDTFTNQMNACFDRFYPNNRTNTFDTFTNATAMITYIARLCLILILLILLPMPRQLLHTLLDFV